MSVLTHLNSRASAAVLSQAEAASINRSIGAIRTRLDIRFGLGLVGHFRFGSSMRGTNLPRSMDGLSDIDYMVVFRNDGSTPQTYLNRLKRFSEIYYSTSEIKQSSPSIVLELNHIRFDIVPAVPAYGGGYHIPNGPNAWQVTDPNDFNASLTRANGNHFHLIKPMVRLLKYWNAQQGYVFDSYELERFAIRQTYFLCTNLEDYLFYAIHAFGRTGTQWGEQRIQRAKQIITQVREYERLGYALAAETEVRKLIPASSF